MLSFSMDTHFENAYERADLFECWWFEDDAILSRSVFGDHLGGCWVLNVLICALLDTLSVCGDLIPQGSNYPSFWLCNRSTGVS